MAELSQLIEQLQKEVAELERALRLREAEEAARLQLEEARLRTAQARLTRAQATLKSEAAELATIEEKRSDLLARIDSWRGKLWQVAHGAVPLLTVTMVATAYPLAKQWLGGDWALGISGAQLVSFLVLYFVIPQKR